ncbi:MAG: hypothetical protein N5P05_002047 [Chroococcopsis gigantea SAG 12.99]|nr:hypothetical protein [Chroococcopsis gigantea SAG 12.99]
MGLMSLPLKAAEKIKFVYTPLVISLPVSSLETFAKDGTIDNYLRDYLGSVSPDEKSQFREALLKRVDVNPIFVSRFFNTAMGSEMLYRLGKGITIEGGINGKYALRGAIISAALDKDGLTLLNVLKKFPTNIQLQGELILASAKEIDILVAASELFTKKMRDWTEAEAKEVQTSVNYQGLPDIRKSGNYRVKREVWQLTDKSRNRSLYADVYIPEPWREGKTPVIVFSHGLASRPEDYSAGLEHLASYGYFIIAPQHPGSDLRYLQGMLEGYNRNIFDVKEFIDRPKDISFVIDELERRNQTQFQNRLDLQNVGLAGHSFGGYTAIAVAGAEIDFDNLRNNCQQLFSGLNLSVLLECRALELPPDNYRFRDERVKAVFAANPVNRSIFGEKGLAKIEIPILLAAGSYDPAANPIFEQAASFTWLKTQDKYLAMVEGQAHVNFNELDGGMKKTLDSVKDLSLPGQNLIGSYSDAILTAFFEIYISKNDSFRPFLQSAYAQYLSEGEQFKLDFISAASSDSLAEELYQFRRQHGLRGESGVGSRESGTKALPAKN